MQEVRVAKFWRTVLRPERQSRVATPFVGTRAQPKHEARQCGWLPVGGGIGCAEVAAAQSASPDRPSLEAVLYHLGERRTRVQLLVRHACNDRISILDTLFVDDPRSQPVAGQPRGDAIGYRVD